jgi:uncharacterized protein (TIGR02466 family)
MKKLLTSQEKIYEFHAPKDLFDKVYEQVLKINFYKNAHNKISIDASRKDQEQEEKNLAKNPNFDELHQWFMECIQKVSVDTGYECDFKIVHTWANKSEKQEKHHEHNHPMAVISGVFYLTTAGENGGGETYYVYNSTAWDKAFLRYIQEEKYYVKPEAGKLILFPSMLNHGCLPHKEENPRYTIAFDAFPCGQLARMEKEGIDLVISVVN